MHDGQRHTIRIRLRDDQHCDVRRSTGWSRTAVLPDTTPAPIDLPADRLLTADSDRAPGTAWTRVCAVELDGAAILDPANASDDYTKIANTGTAGGDWTISRAATGFKTAVVDRPLLLFGGGQTMTSPPIPEGTGTLIHSVRQWPAGPVDLVAVHDGGPVVLDGTYEHLGSALWGRVLTDDEVARASEALAGNPRVEDRRRVTVQWSEPDIRAVALPAAHTTVVEVAPPPAPDVTPDETWSREELLAYLASLGVTGVDLPSMSDGELLDLITDILDWP